MSKELVASRVTAIKAHMGNLNVAPDSKEEKISASVEAPSADTSNKHPATEPSGEDDDRFSIFPGFSMHISGWAIGQDAVMKALGITDVSDNRIINSVRDLSHYVKPTGRDVRVGAYLKAADLENLDVIDEYVIVADGTETPEGLEARLCKRKEFPPEIWRIHKWMKGPHVFKKFKNIGSVRDAIGQPHRGL